MCRRAIAINILGSLSASALGPAVVRAVEADLPEVVLTSRTQRPALALQALFPRLFERAARLSGVHPVFRVAADGHLALRARADRDA